MGPSQSVIAAFSEEQTIRLTGVTKAQLRYWDRTGFYRPSYGSDNRRVAFSRVYSFRDIVALRVLNTLRTHIGVSLQHLREVSARLGHLDDPWTGVRLWVLNKRVIWQEPGTEQPQEIVSQQYVAPAIVLDDYVNATRADVERVDNSRDRSQVGTIERRRHVVHSEPVVAGTRIPVKAIKSFAEAGYSIEQIREEYPDLTDEDVRAALEYENDSHAA